ncbi:MAG: D-alanyl-D-alanine carboxypeptidase/D-alanyl-D-alanine-endopeptidase [Knoellia sp.]
MTASRAGRTILVSAAATVAALALAAGGTVAPASAIGSSPNPLPESQPPVDTPQDIQRDLDGASSRQALAGSILERLKIAGADPALGSGVSAVVLDSTTGAVIYSRNPSKALMPASNEKLTTAFVALTTMGPHKTFQTDVRVDAARTTLWLRGGGDPALTAAAVRTMAGQAHAALVKAGKRSVAVRVDDSLFPAPTNAIGWKTTYVPGDVAPVRALVVDGRNLMDTSLDAGNVFRNELVRLGLTVTPVARATTPSTASVVTSVVSPPVSTLVAKMLNTSSNDYAEFLHRQSSIAAGKGATWAAANAHSLATLKARGVNTLGVTVQDGSGLSRSDRGTGTSISSLLYAIRNNWLVNYYFFRPDAMPTSGVSGTLASRFAQPDTLCARRKVRAKTGTLSDVTALSGTADGVDGKRRIFSIVENGAPNTAAARFALERFATAATGCNPA